jgi:prolipoprotein diacylglyceryltransferase
VYGIINALLLAGVLLLIANRRRRHGAVFGWMLLLYPITRVVLEVIRVDNPHDVGALTISQAFSVGVFAAGLAWMLLMYKWLPMRSPYAVPWVPPQHEGGERKAESRQTDRADQRKPAGSTR